MAFCLFIIAHVFVVLVVIIVLLFVYLFSCCKTNIKKRSYLNKSLQVFFFFSPIDDCKLLGIHWEHRKTETKLILTPFLLSLLKYVSK